MSAEPERRQIAALVDLDRYPIDATGTESYAALVTRCRSQLNDVGCAVLPGFLTEAGLASLRDESAAVAARAYYSRQRTNVYFSADDESLPADHPKRMFFDPTRAIRELGLPLEDLGDFATPTFATLHNLTRRLVSQDAKLYACIQLQNPANRVALRALEDAVADILYFIQRQNVDGLVRLIEGIR